MAVGYIWITKTPFVEHSRQVKVFVSRIFGTIAEDAHKLVIAFQFVSNHSTWSMGFSAAPARVQALYSSTVGAFYSHTRVASYKYHSWIFVANLNIAEGVNPFVSNGEHLGEPRLNVSSQNLTNSPTKSHHVITARSKTGESDCRNLVNPGCFWQCNIAIFACVSGQRTSCLSLSFSFFLFFFFHCSPMKIR